MRRGDAKPRRAARLKTTANGEKARGLSARAFPAKRRTCIPLAAQRLME
jgi:hypothetical protein